MFVPGRQDAGRNADRHRSWRNITYHHGIGADDGAVAYGDVAKDFRAGTDIDSIADMRRSPLAGAPQAYGHAVAQDDVIAEDGIATHDDA